MENLNAITAFFARIWDLFTMEHPLLGVPYSVIYLGSFAVAFSTAILRPLLGIGGGTINDISGSARNARRSAVSRREAKIRADYNKSYAKYQADRKRNEAFAERYRRENK